MDKWRRWILISALLVLASGSVRADIDGLQYRSAEWNVRLNSPRGWQVSEHSTYPGILLWMIRQRPSARMLLSAERLSPKMAHAKNTQAYAVETTKRLSNLGYDVRAPQLHSASGAFWMDFDDGKHFLRQAVLIPKSQATAFTLTLSTSDPNTRRHLLRVFDYALRSIKPIE